MGKMGGSKWVKWAGPIGLNGRVQMGQMFESNCVKWASPIVSKWAGQMGEIGL